MKKDIHKLSIARLNSFGNFTCSVWSKDGIVIGNEEGLKGRSSLILNEIEKKIKKKYSFEELKNKTILDVGCYDGFYLTHLSHFKFKKIVGLEPKKKNIIKGKEIRKFLKIEEPEIDFVCGDLSTFKTNEKFDIVLCLGVLHHTADHLSFLKRLKNFTSEILFIDTRVVQDKLVNKNFFLQNIEMLDVIYKFKRPKISFSAHKFESNFNDSSTHETGLVSIPNSNTLEMFLETLNYKTEILVSEKEYRKRLNHNRPLDGLLICSEPKKFKSSLSFSYPIKYEKKILKTIFENDFIENIYNIYMHKISFKSLITKNFYIYVILKNKKYHFLFDLFFKKKFNKNQIEILKNLHYSFEDKINYELAKKKYYEEDFDGAEELLNKIIYKLNSDFRTVYRSYYLLYKISKKKNLSTHIMYAEYYLRLFLGRL